jgi:hypothetical protein
MRECTFVPFGHETGKVSSTKPETRDNHPVAVEFVAGPAAALAPPMTPDQGIAHRFDGLIADV